MKIRLTLLVALTFSSLPSFADTEGSKPYFKEQIHLEEAHRITMGKPTVKVAILATGVNYQLPQFLDKFDYRKEGTGIYPGDVIGADVAAMTGDPMDTLGVGTSVAGLIASSDYGVAPGVKIIPIKVTNDSGGGDYEGLARGFDYAIARGANIIFLDLGGGDIGPNAEQCASIRLAEKHGILVIAPSGNTGAEVEASLYPPGCNIPGLLSVTTTDEKKNIASFASWSSQYVHIAAPGIKLPTLSLQGKDTELSGGSASASLVVGAAALVVSNHPDYSALEVKKALLQSVTPEESLTGKVSSGGILNVYKALTTRVK